MIYLFFKSEKTKVRTYGDCYDASDVAKVLKYKSTLAMLANLPANYYHMDDDYNILLTSKGLAEVLSINDALVG